VTTHENLVEALSEGGWHARREIEELTVFPEEWLKELLYEGHEVLKDEAREVVVRLQEPPAA
jgi:hypothetical protein